jgi:hypothetical protein
VGRFGRSSWRMQKPGNAIMLCKVRTALPGVCNL